MDYDYRKFPATSLIVGVCVVVYLYTTIKYGFEMNAYQGIEAGGFNPILVVELKQYYRLITANFIHFGIMHIFCNCYSLMNFGSIMEHLLGTKRYLIILLSSALATTVLPFIYYVLTGNGANSIMGGISGAIFGLMGSLFALAWKFRNVYVYLFKQIAPSVILMLLISVAVPSISLSGHISGMIGGFIVTLLVIKFMPLSFWELNNHNFVN